MEKKLNFYFYLYLQVAISCFSALQPPFSPSGQTKHNYLRSQYDHERQFAKQTHHRKHQKATGGNVHCGSQQKTRLQKITAYNKPKNTMHSVQYSRNTSPKNYANERNSQQRNGLKNLTRQLISHFNKAKKLNNLF